MSLIVDSSITLAWVYAEETTEAVAEILARVTERGALVPSLWHLEVANVLEMGVRRGRHDRAFRDVTLADLALLPITVDPETHQQAWTSTLHLAERHKLTFYDAAYLELAQRRGLPLSSLDTDLCRAALVEGVVVLGESSTKNTPSAG